MSNCNESTPFVYQKEIFKFEGEEFKYGFKLYVSSAQTERTPSMVTLLYFKDAATKPSLYLYKIDFDQSLCVEFAVTELLPKLKTSETLPEGFIQKLLGDE